MTALPAGAVPPQVINMGEQPPPNAPAMPVAPPPAAAPAPLPPSASLPVPGMVPGVAVTNAPPMAPAPAPGAPQAAPLPYDTPVSFADGRKVGIGDLQAAYDIASELGLDDPDQFEFMRTVSRAARGDQSALQQLTAMNTAAAPALPAAVAPNPYAPVAAAPVAPVAAAPAQPNASNQIAAAMRQAFEPISNKVNQMYGQYQDTRRVQQVDAVDAHLKQRAAEFPMLSATPGSADRVFQQWDNMVANAAANGQARPSQHQLADIMRREESYIASVAGGQAPVAPAPMAGVPPVITRMDQPIGRVAGRAIPGREDYVAPYSPPTNVAAYAPAAQAGYPAQMPVAHAVPPVAAPAAAPVAQPTAVLPMGGGKMSENSLAHEIQSQANALMGVNR